MDLIDMQYIQMGFAGFCVILIAKDMWKDICNSKNDKDTKDKLSLAMIKQAESNTELVTVIRQLKDVFKEDILELKDSVSYIRDEINKGERTSG